jgi:hypothetical protein
MKPSSIGLFKGRLIEISSLFFCLVMVANGATAQSWVTNVKVLEEKEVEPPAPLITKRFDYFWPNTEIQACWENPAEHKKLAKRIELAVNNSWVRHSGLSIEWKQKCDENSMGIRVYFDSSAETEPHNTKPGKFLDGVKNGVVLNPIAQPLQEAQCIQNLFSDGCVEAWAVHQFGHALGLTHKKTALNGRKDRPCSELHYSDEAPDFYYSDKLPAKASVMSMCEERLANRHLLDLEKIIVATVYGNPRPAIQEKQPFWAGVWNTSASGRSYKVNLKQEGDRVVGTYIQQVSDASGQRASGEIEGVFTQAPEQWRVMNKLLNGKWKRTDSGATEDEQGSFYFQGRELENGANLFTGSYMESSNNQTRSWNGSMNRDEF